MSALQARGRVQASGRSLSLMGKSTCMTLMEDIRKTLVIIMNHEKKDQHVDFIICSIAAKKNGFAMEPSGSDISGKTVGCSGYAKREQEYAAVAKELKHFPILKTQRVSIKDMFHISDSSSLPKAKPS